MPWAALCIKLQKQFLFGLLLLFFKVESLKEGSRAKRMTVPEDDKVQLRVYNNLKTSTGEPLGNRTISFKMRSQKDLGKLATQFCRTIENAAKDNDIDEAEVPEVLILIGVFKLIRS